MSFSRESDGAQRIAGIGLINDNSLFLGAYSDIIFGSGASAEYTSSYERMRITAAGNVGIGTAGPEAKLQIVPDAAYSAINTGQAFVIRNTGLTGANLAMGVSGSYGNIIQSRDGASTGYALLLNPFGGNVGVGSYTTPNGKFEVNHGNGSDGTVFYSAGDNSQSIQSYIDGHWSDRASYASGCCNTLNINTDAGDIVMGSSGRTVTVTPAGAIA